MHPIESLYSGQWIIVFSNSVVLSVIGIRPLMFFAGFTVLGFEP